MVRLQSSPMRIFAIGDLHLSHAQPKPMSIFGPAWLDHDRRIARAWRERVGDDDVVLVAGDTSWAMRLDQARPDLEYLARLPGRKVMIKGNHDYWWSSEAKVRAALPEGISILNGHGTAISERAAVAGTRLWVDPAVAEATPADAKIFQRELGRLQRGLEQIDRLGAEWRIAMVHYPPTSFETAGPVEQLLANFGVTSVIYGHLHGDEDHGRGVKGTVRGIQYHLVSADFVGFVPVLIGAV